MLSEVACVGLLVLFLFLLRWFLGCLLFFLLKKKRRKKRQKVKTLTASTRKMPPKRIHCSATIAACDSCLNMTFLFPSLLFFFFNNPKYKHEGKKKDLFDEPHWYEKYPGEGWAICSGVIHRWWVMMRHPASSPCMLTAAQDVHS